MASVAEKDRVPFNRDVLKWARERVKLSPDSAAKGVGVTVDHIQKWEIRRQRPHGEAGPQAG